MSAVLQVSGVGISFSGLRALNDVSLTVGEQQIVGLIGPNGAGKTTLFNVIAGQLDPDAGRVEFEGRDITAWPPQRIARAGVGRTFQLMRPFGTMGIVENVMVGAFARVRDRKRARAEAERVVERVGLTDSVGVQAAELSTAGQKRLELARALALEPRLLLLDEVLSGLTPTERGPLIELLRELREEGLAMLFVEHVMSAVMELSDAIVVLHHGEVLAAGSPAEVTSDPAVIDAYLGEGMTGAET